MKLTLDNLSESQVLSVLMELVPHKELCDVLITLQQQGSANMNHKNSIETILKHLPNVKLSTE